MATANPFAPSMARLQIPKGMAQSVHVDGFEIQADDDGIVEVPMKFRDDLMAHGLQEPKAKPAGK